MLNMKHIRLSLIHIYGNVLAQTVVGDDGSETREYPYGEVFAHAIGYSNSKLGTTGCLLYTSLHSKYGCAMMN